MTLRPRPVLHFAALALLLTGGALLLLATVGALTSLSHGVDDPKRDWETFDPALVTEIPDYPTLVKKAEAAMALQTTDSARMQVLSELVSLRFTHDEARHNWASNWLLWLAGQVHHTFLHRWNPKDFVAESNSLFCDQISYLLLHLARTHGIKARHVGLQGHVVMEAWYDDEWHLYDPDLEIIPLGPDGKVLSLDSLAHNEALLQKYYGPYPGMADLVRNRRNHLYMSTPDGARFEWKGNILAVVEQVAEVLKFLLPLLFILIGWRVARRTAPLPAAKAFSFQAKEAAVGASNDG